MKSVKSSLTRKLVVVSLLATLLPLLAWGVYSYSYSMHNIEREYLSSIDNNLLQLKYNLSMKVDTCKQIALSYAGDRHLISFLQYGTQDDYSMVNIVKDNILTRLQTVQIYNGDFYTVRLIHGNERIPQVYDHLFCDPRFQQGWWQQYMRQLGSPASQGEYYLNLAHAEDVYMKLSFGEPRDATVFSFYYPIYSTYSLNLLLGVFEVSIKEDMFYKPLLEQKLADGIVQQVVRRDGAVAYSTEPGFAAPAQQDASLSKGDYFVTRVDLPSLGCQLVQYTPKALLYRNAAYPSLVVFGLLAVLLASALMAVTVYHLVLAKLGSMSRTIHRIQKGDLKARMDVDGNDELGELAQEFNVMTQKTAELLQKVEQSGRSEKEAVYKALENQISPHFLCNALDSVRMTAETQDNRPIADAMELISSYFMYNIYKRSKFVTLLEELKNVTDYLNITNLIRTDKIEYVLDVAPEVRASPQNYRILKFTLQPIIENCVKHGFKGRRSNCLILLRARPEQGCVEITVEDNGAGMDAGTLAQVRRLLREQPQSPPATDTSIGLGNIRDRLCLQYGDACRMHIESIPGVGTKVSLILPVREG